MRMRGAILALMVGLIAPAALGAGSTPATPLERCWQEVATRVELAPCLERLLAAAEAALGTALADAERAAGELDAVIGARGRNAERLAASQAAWRAYRDAECARQAEAMAPGTGSGDVLLACRIGLTEARRATLDRP